MAVNEYKQSLKVSVKLVKGSVTVSKLDTEATDVNLVKFGNAVGALCSEAVDKIYKVETLKLVQGL